jgi:hypothetical protein
MLVFLFVNNKSFHQENIFIFDKNNSDAFTFVNYFCIMYLS